MKFLRARLGTEIYCLRIEKTSTDDDEIAKRRKIDKTKPRESKTSRGSGVLTGEEFFVV